VSYLPAALEAEVLELDPRARALFDSEWNRRTKSSGVGFLCAVLGLHYAYLGRWGLQVIYWLTAGGLLIWWFVDLIRVFVLVRDRNADEAVLALRDVRALRG